MVSPLVKVFAFSLAIAAVYDGVTKIADPLANIHQDLQQLLAQQQPSRDTFSPSATMTTTPTQAQGIQTAPLYTMAQGYQPTAG
jgi:hypothetical protein